MNTTIHRRPAAGRPARTALLQLGSVLALLGLSGCLNFGAVDLAPGYEPDKFVVPPTWRGSGPFVEAQPADGVLRKDWWTLFDDPVLTLLEEQAAAGNPDLQAAAERFVQARDEMMKARSQFLPQVGLNPRAQGQRESVQTLFRPPNAPTEGRTLMLGGGASWEPDFWSELRNATRVQMYRAEEMAAAYALARLSIQAELASDYFTLRGLDARDAIYRQSVAYYEQSLGMVKAQFNGAIASELDVARAEYLLTTTQARQFGIQAQRQVVEHALAILVNMAPASFSIAPRDVFEVAKLQIPTQVPSALLERRPDIAASERRMAQANRVVGIARAAFFPRVTLRATGGFEGGVSGLFNLPNSLWSYGAMVEIPLFQAGYLRAQLQQSWSMYREMEDSYRSTVLNAFREVEDGLSLTQLLSAEVERQQAAVEAAQKAQTLTVDLFKGGLASSLELIFAQLNTLESRLGVMELRADLLKSVVGLMRALGGGFSREDLPKDGQIQPFKVFGRQGRKPPPVGGIDVDAEDHERNNDLTKPVTR